MSDIISGVFWYKEKNYPFVLEGQKVRLVDAPFSILKFSNDMEEVPFVQGVTSGNRDILFLHCRFNPRLPLSNVAFTIAGYLLSSSNTGHFKSFEFDRVSFYADAINTFYSPQNALDIQSDFDDWDGSAHIHVKTFSETQIRFNFGQDEVELNMDRWVRERRDLTRIGSVESSTTFYCSEKKQPIEIDKYYLAIYDFLCFVNYSLNISFNKIHLFSKNDDGIDKQIASAHFFSNHSTYENDESTTITSREIPQEKLGALFSKVALLRGKDQRLPFYYPPNKNEARLIDSGKWLITAICFEGLFEDTFPQFKSKSNPVFQRIKELVSSKADEIDTEGFSKKEKKYFDAFKEHINRYEGVLEEKFNYVFKAYKSCYGKILEGNDRRYHVNQKENYGKIYMNYRNKLAHGTIEPITEKEIAVYRLLCPMIYTMILQNDFTEDEIYNMISKVFSS